MTTLFFFPTPVVLILKKNILLQQILPGAYSGICPGGLTFFIFPGGAQHPLGPENPLKSIDLTGSGGA